MTVPRPGQAAPDWTAQVEALAPAIRACLEAVGPGSFAVQVLPLEEGTAQMLVWRAMPGERYVATLCHYHGADHLAWHPRPGQAWPDAAEPAFFLERRCVDARRVEAADGRILGWLAYPACR